MEELITLYYRNFAILGDRVRDFAQQTGCSNHIVGRPLRSQIFLNELKREHWSWATVHRQEWGLFLLEYLLHNANSMRKKEHQKYSRRPQAEETEEVAPEHPSVRALLGAIIQVAEQVYQGEWTLALSMLSYQQHNECMRELLQELSRHMASAGLWVTPNLMRPSRSRRWSWGYSAS